MTLIPTTAAAAATSAITPNHGHGRKGGHAESIEDATASTSPTASGTTQNLFSTLLQSIEQVIGVSVAGSAPAAAGTTAVTGTHASTSAAAGSSTLGGAALSATRLGSKVNATA
jgi:hypothetical protein